MEEAGIIEEVQEPKEGGTPMVIVRKSNRKLRVCVDLRKLNSTVNRARLIFLHGGESVNHGVPQGSVLDLMLFNIFINNLFFHVKRAKLNAYADDQQVYYSLVDPSALEPCISDACHDVGVANQWCRGNGMRHQGLVLGDANYGFSFPVKIRFLEPK